MEIKPMGNTEQEKMSSLWGYFIACCKILDDVTIEYQEPCVLMSVWLKCPLNSILKAKPFWT